MEAIVALGVNHLLIDLPSVDPEFDQGKLIAHRIFGVIRITHTAEHLVR